MNIKNKTVNHNKWGRGIIISQTDSGIEVEFKNHKSKFQYPDAFENFLTLEDSDLQDAIINELNEKKLIERKKIAETAEANRNTSEHPTIYKRMNIAFKCNFCDGGKSKEQVGFCGACSDEIIKNNILVEHRIWCTQNDCPCFQYLNNEISRSELDSFDYACYESQMLRDWRAFAGEYHSGSKKGTAMTLRQVQNNSLCVLTTRNPGSNESERYVFGVFLVDSFYEGNENEAGFVNSHKKYRLKLSPEEAYKILFWKYYKNKNSPERIQWGSGLHRYINDDTAVRILYDIAKIKHGTADEQLAEEFLNHFIKSNNIVFSDDLESVGALKL